MTHRTRCQIAVAAGLCLLSASVLAQTSAAIPPSQYGDRQAGQFGDRQSGNFGDIDQGHFGNPASGEFIENNFPRHQEGQIRAVDARATGANNGGKAKSTESPYITLPQPLDHTNTGKKATGTNANANKKP